LKQFLDDRLGQLDRPIDEEVLELEHRLDAEGVPVLQQKVENVALELA
jgi:hypothetical protein